MTDRDPPDHERDDGERGDEEPRDRRRRRVDTSHLDATLEGLPEDPAPPMPHLRPISGMTSGWHRESPPRHEPEEVDPPPGAAPPPPGSDPPERATETEQPPLPWNPAPHDEAPGISEVDRPVAEESVPDTPQPAEDATTGFPDEEPPPPPPPFRRLGDRNGLGATPGDRIVVADETAPDSAAADGMEGAPGTPVASASPSAPGTAEDEQDPEPVSDFDEHTGPDETEPVHVDRMDELGTPRTLDELDDRGAPNEQESPGATLDKASAGIEATAPGSAAAPDRTSAPSSPAEDEAGDGEGREQPADEGPSTPPPPPAVGWRSRLLGRKTASVTPPEAPAAERNDVPVASADDGPQPPVEAAAKDAVPAAEPAAEPTAVPRRSARVPVNAYGVVLVALATAVFLAFVLIDPAPRWMLLVGTGAVIFGLDGVLRATWREPFVSGEPTTPYLFLPALYMLGAPAIVQQNVPAPWVIPIGLGIGVGFSAIMLSELISVRPGSPHYPLARLIATAGAYFTLFAIASMTYVFDASLAWSLIAMAMLGVMLGIEVLREGEIDPMETLIFSTVVGFVLLQARWVLHYLPLDTYMAGLTLTLVFFFTTGLLHAHITRRFEFGVVVEYSGIAAAGLALVVAARATGLA